MYKHSCRVFVGILSVVWATEVLAINWGDRSPLTDEKRRQMREDGRLPFESGTQPAGGDVYSDPAFEGKDAPAEPIAAEPGWSGDPTMEVHESSSASGGRFSAGVHVGVTAGGDTDSQEPVFGAQGVFMFSQSLGIELGISSVEGTQETSYPELGSVETREIEATVISLSAIFSAPLTPSVTGFVTAGLDYHQFDGGLSVDLSTFQSELNASFGLPPGAIALDGSGSLDLDDQLGFHLGLGGSVAVSPSIDLFADFRFVFVELDGTESVTIAASGLGDTFSDSESFPVSEDFNHGIFRVGANFRF